MPRIRLDPARGASPSVDFADRGAAQRIVRGVRRALAQHGLCSLREVTLAIGRRADVMAIDGKGRVTIVEVKSGPPDFRADRKWPDYELYCDYFYFAVDGTFPTELLPADRGLLIADAYDAAVHRVAPESPLAPARRRAVLLRFAQVAAQRLHGFEDPDA